jgi:hypothetical protein
MGHGPGHWQGMVCKVIVVIMVFMIVIGNMDNTVLFKKMKMNEKRMKERKTNRQTGRLDLGGWVEPKLV